jgi:hypothetical protein
MPPEGGDLFIDEDDDGDADEGGVRVVFAHQPSGRVCADNDSACVLPHVESPNVHE